MKPEMLEELSDTAYPHGYTDVARKALGFFECIHRHADHVGYTESEHHSGAHLWASLQWDEVLHRKTRPVRIAVDFERRVRMKMFNYAVGSRHPDFLKTIFETPDRKGVKILYLADVIWSETPVLGAAPLLLQGTSFRELLERYKDADDVETLGDFVAALIDANPVSELKDWLSRDFRDWIVEGRIALASILEASVQLGIPEAQYPIYEVLRSSSVHAQVASVAAQRIRMLPVPETAEVKGLWQILRSFIESWARHPETEQYAILALPSVAYIALDDAAEWLSELIANGPPRLAEAAALGMIDARRRRSDQSVEDSLPRVTKSLLHRWDSETSSATRDQQLVAALVWSLGATATAPHLERIVEVIVESFQRPTWAEDAAAVRAGRMLYARFKGRAMTLVANELGGVEAEAWQKFQLAVLRPALVS